MTSRTLDSHLSKDGSKRILALDGGGIRGILTLGYLKVIEDMLRDRCNGDAQFRLCDYFDLIGGTSTGSIIAAGLAIGFSVDELQKLYRELGGSVFAPSGLPFLAKFKGILAPKFPTGPVDTALKAQLGEQTMLGHGALRTGLMVMTKRLDTGSPWPLHNNPAGKYFNRRPDGNNIPNSEFLLWQIVRASTAAPSYFEPEIVEVSTDVQGQRVRGAFVDGGVSPHGNPALQLVLVATLKGFQLDWKRGENELLVISIGTGYSDFRIDADAAVKMPSAEMAVRSLTSMMGDADALVRLQMQWMGKTLFSMPAEVDGEVGDLSGDTLDGRNLMSYVRYNASLERDWLRKELQIDIDEAEAASLAAMDNARNIERLATIGAVAAQKQIKPDHFPSVFDVK